MEISSRDTITFYTYIHAAGKEMLSTTIQSLRPCLDRSLTSPGYSSCVQSVIHGVLMQSPQLRV